MPRSKKKSDVIRHRPFQWGPYSLIVVLTKKETDMNAKQTLYRRALGDAFSKLNPRHLVHNPVMFVVEIGSLLLTLLFILGLLGFAAPFGQRFSKVGKQHGKPKPGGDGSGKSRVIAQPLSAEEGKDKQHCQQQAANFHDKHHRIVHQMTGIQFAKRVA